jgi:DNA-binding IscR family transcriptional regulator
VADRLDSPAEPVREVLALLEEAGFLSESDDGRLSPARPLPQVSVADVRRVIAGPPPRAPGEEATAKLAILLAEGEGAAVERLSRTTFEDLCRTMRDRKPGPAETTESAPGGPEARIPS